MVKIKYKFSLFIISLLLPLSSFANDAVTPAQQALLKDLPADQRESVKKKMQSVNKSSNEIEEIFEEESVLVERPEKDLPEKCDECIFGYSMFKFAPSTFAPANSVPISSTYTLGPGDKVKINYYGSEKEKLETFISRDGTIDLPILGPINLAGLSLREARELLKEKIASELIGTRVSFNLAELRSITVYVLGQAYKPGSYTLSALSSVTNALYLSGGPDQNGSLRNIKVRRGSTETNYDLYKLLVKGDSSGDVNLEDGDIVFIPFIENKVQLQGAFKRPHLYEFIEGETVKDAINFAGGFASGSGLSPRVEYSTINNLKNKREDAVIVQEKDYLTTLKNGDSINASGISGIKTELVEIAGEISRPGAYSINENDTVLDIINRAGGYTRKAYTDGIVFTREQVALQQKEAFNRAADSLEQTLIDVVTQSTKEINEYSLAPISSLINKLRTEIPVGRQVVNFDILSLKKDPYENFDLINGDKIYIPKRPQSINVVGEIRNPSTLQFKPGMSAQQYINQAGGYSKNADSGQTFIILPNGKSYLHKKKFFSDSNSLLPGSTIVVSRNSRSFDAISITQIVTPILADLATSAAAIAAISND